MPLREKALWRMLYETAARAVDDHRNSPVLIIEFPHPVMANT